MKFLLHILNTIVRWLTKVINRYNKPEIQSGDNQEVIETEEPKPTGIIITRCKVSKVTIKPNNSNISTINNDSE